MLSSLAYLAVGFVLGWWLKAIYYKRLYLLRTKREWYADLRADRKFKVDGAAGGCHEEITVLSDEQLRAIKERREKDYPDARNNEEAYYDARSDVTALLTHVAELTAILNSGRRTIVQGRFGACRNEWAIRIPDGVADWHQGVVSEWPVTDTGSTRTSTLGSEADQTSDANTGEVQ